MNKPSVSSLVIGFVVLAAVVIVLATPTPKLEKYPNREKVIFWHMWSGEWQPIVERACQRFNEHQTKYEVIPLSVPAGGAETKFLMSAAGGRAPDLVSQWNPVKGSWTNKRLIQPIENIMTPAEKERYLREAWPIMREQALEQGKIMAVVASVDVNALYVRTDILRKAGYSIDDIPKTLEEFVPWSRKLDKKDANGVPQRLGFIPRYGDQYVALFRGGFGTADNPKLDTPENRRAFLFLSQEMKRIGYGNVQRFLSSQAADAGMSAPLITGNFAMMLDGQWRVKQAKDFAPNLEYEVIPMPSPKGFNRPASMTDANYLMIPTAAKSPKGAWEFIKYWIGFDDPEIGARNMVEMGWLPYSEVVAKTKTYQQYLRDYPQYRTFVELIASPDLKTAPVGPLQAYVKDQLAKVDEAVSRGSTPPLVALERAQKQIDVEMARQRRLGNIREAGQP